MQNASTDVVTSDMSMSGYTCGARVYKRVSHNVAAGNCVRWLDHVLEQN